MNSQPNEIITHILSYLDNYTLMFARSTCHKWKHLIETRIFYKKIIPALHVCIVTDDYYHFVKHYLNYNYDTGNIFIMDTIVNDVNYYDNLITILPNKKIFRNFIPITNKFLSINQLLICASWRGHLEMTKYLISIGADLHAYNDNALRLSARDGHLEMTKYLISIGADLHADNDNALRLSARDGHLEMTKYLISIGADLHADNDEALRWSARKGHLEVIKYLISIGADLHADNDEALRWSAGYGHLEVVKYLISMGADLHSDNEAALRWSAGHGQLEVVKYLISMGADLHADDDWILKNSTSNVIEYLKFISGKN